MQAVLQNLSFIPKQMPKNNEVEIKNATMKNGTVQQKKT